MAQITGIHPSKNRISVFMLKAIAHLTAAIQITGYLTVAGVKQPVAVSNLHNKSLLMQKGHKNLLPFLFMSKSRSSNLQSTSE
jgi:hypothetical protein